MVKTPMFSMLPLLADKASRMNFFRFCELLELSAPDSPGLGTTDSLLFEAVRFRSREHLGFPQQEIDMVGQRVVPDPADARDLADVANEGRSIQGPLEVSTTFLGLYGVDARMPSYFIDTIAQHKDGAEVLAAFLDMFHHRIVTQFYRVWRKYRYPIGYRSEGNDQVSRCLLSLAGLDSGAEAFKSALDARGVIAMLGLLSQRTRTAEGLASVLQHALPNTDIHVEECFSTWVRAGACSGGGSKVGKGEGVSHAWGTLTASGRSDPAGAKDMAGALGHSCLLGRGCYDRSNTVLVEMTPGSRDAVLGLVPGEGDYRQVALLLSLYLGYTSNAHLRMKVGSGLMPAPYLKSPSVRLGYTSQFNDRVADRRQMDSRDVARPRQTRVTLGTWTAGSRTLHQGDGSK